MKIKECAQRKAREFWVAVELRTNRIVAIPDWRNAPAGEENYVPAIGDWFAQQVYEVLKKDMRLIGDKNFHVIKVCEIEDYE